MSSVLLLRHGAHSDVGRRLTGRAPDEGLTPAGRAQVLAACSSLAGTPPTAIYTSPRRRTVETATIVANYFSLPIEQSAALDEIDFGEWTGKSFGDLASDRRWSEWNSNRSEVVCPGGESMREAQARALAFAFEAASLTKGLALLVSHCDIIRALQCWAERRSLDEILDFDCEPASVTRLDLSPQLQAA